MGIEPITRLGGKFHPHYLPVVFIGLENTPKVTNTGKWSFELAHLEIATEILIKLNDQAHLEIATEILIKFLK